MGRRQRVAWTLVLLLQVTVLVTLVLPGERDEPHAADVGIVAPSVVSASLVQRVEAASDDSRPVAVTSAAEARRGVREGRLLAAVVVDLSAETDTLFTASAHGEDVQRSVVERTRLLESSFGRTATVDDIVPARPGDPDHRRLDLLVGAWLLVGFGTALVLTWRGGPVAPTFGQGARRLVVAGAVGVVAGVLGALLTSHAHGGSWVAWAAIGALLSLAAASVVLALESLVGVLGIGLATAGILLTAAPRLSATPTQLLPGAWAAVTPYLPHGAALDAVTSIAFFDAAGWVRPVLVLLAWFALAVLTLVVARRERGRP